MRLRIVSGACRPQLWRRRARAEGGAVAIACASAMPLIVLAVAVAADYASVSRFRTRVQLAVDAASVAASRTIAQHPDGARGRGIDDLAEHIAAGVFVMNAPRGAGGRPTVETTSRASAVTTTVGYQGVAPSNFGSALGYGAINVNATATSLSVVADSRTTPAP
jgi:Flp pilus assembly protein TadG